MVDRARYEALALGLPGAEPRRHFRLDGFGVNGKQFVHRNKDALFLAMTAEDAPRANRTRDKRSGGNGAQDPVRT